MKKFLCITIPIVLILICLFVFKTLSESEKEKLNSAKQATEIVAMEKLGKDCVLISQGVYLGPAPFGKGFWFGFVDKEETTAVVYTAVHTLDGKDWYVREHTSQYGGDYRLFFAKFR